MARSRLLPDNFTLYLVATVIAASLLPASGGFAKALEVATTVAVSLLFFLHGAKLSREAILAGIGHWRLHLVVVASTFIIGGFIMLWAERRQEKNPTLARIQNVEAMTPMDALKVGLVQCLAMIPGTSRSGATIIGGMLLGLSRKAATDFSFYLAIPTLIGAGVYSLYKERALLSLSDVPLFGVGLVFSFISAWLCVRWLLKFISTHSFVGFAYYRIAFGLVVLATAKFGWVTWAA